MDEVILCESETLRQKLCTNENTNLLDRVGELVQLPGTAWATVEDIADFYIVGIETIKSIVKRHRKELEKDGYRLLSKKELEKENIKIFETSNRGITIFPRRAVLRIGMILQHSEVAEVLRSYLLNIEKVKTHNGNSLMQMANQLTQHSVQIGKNVEELGKIAQVSLDQSRLICAVVADVYKNKEKIEQVEIDLKGYNRKANYLEERVEAIEKQIKKSIQKKYISKEEALKLKNKVKSKQENSRRIWKHFKKHFNIKRYIHLPNDKFMEAMHWLDSNYLEECIR